MNSRRSISGALLILLLVATTSTAGAGPPHPISNLAASATINAAQQARIREYAEYWCDQLAEASPEGVAKVRGKLLEPLRALRVGDVFRWEYAKACLPRLEPLIAGDNPHAAVNGMQVVATLATERAVELIIRRCDVEVEERAGARLTAAKCFPIAVRQKTLTDNDINRALRNLGHAAAREHDWLVLRRQFEAIASVQSPVSREVQVAVLRTMTQAMAKQQEGPSDLMRATYPALKLVRDQYLRMDDRAEQKPFGKVLAPVLCDVCTVANDHWDNAQDDPGAKAIYGGAIHITENLLRYIDPELRPGKGAPKTQLGPSWRKRDKPRFETDHSKWRAVLSAPPYEKP